ncbi:MAG TPA: histidinol dehydrogenase [Pseudomonadales bacterium]|jgi:histidinol dehydrogenase|nr:histidinol dehydrogenase [Pseudomonadales bacterium]
MIARLDSDSPQFLSALQSLGELPKQDQIQVRASVADILEDVRVRGDEALVELTNRFDGQSVSDMAALSIGQDQLLEAYESIDDLVRDALIESADRVREYHEHQKASIASDDGWRYTDNMGNHLGQNIRPMSRVGIYAPGGKASYPSTVIMTAIPAQVAGVNEMILCVPTPGGELNPALLAAAHLCGIEHVFSLGGAQAIAAMAFGTEAVPKVDKIVGPGNIYVATAKEMVFGKVGIDMIAGPSEVVIVADDSADPNWVIMDMFAQAEHDEMAQAIVISPSEKLLGVIAQQLPIKLAQQKRRSIISEAISSRGALIKVKDLDEAFEIVNKIAPEHLQLAIDAPEAWLPNVEHAGAVFLGVDTAEVVGDYTAGPSHVLPTSGTARFASPLGVYDFQTRMSIIRCSREGAVKLSRAAAILASEEGLYAHAESALARVKG